MCRKIIIEEMDNGFVLSDNEDDAFVKRVVFESQKREGHDYDKALAKLLRYLCYESFREHSGDKWGKEVIEINIGEGSHYGKLDGNIQDSQG